MADSFLKGSNVVHQSFLPAGFLGAIDDTPYTLDVEKAKALLEEAGVGPINVKLYVRNDQERLEIAQSLQNTMAQAGINRRAPRRHRRRDPRRVPRAQPRDHHGGLGAGLSRPAHQRRHLRAQPRQQRRGQQHRHPRLAQRLAGDRDQRHDQRRRARAGRRQARGDVPGDPAHPPAGLALRAAVPADRAGGDARERRGLLGRRLDQLGRLLRDDEVAAAGGPPRPAGGAMAHQEDITGPGHLERATRGWRGGSRASSLTLAVTLLGLLAVTFVIGRVIPIDPVLAIIGERATAGAVRGRARRRSGSTTRSGCSSRSTCATRRPATSASRC